MKTALITGVTGQDGSYLAEFLRKKHYKVYGFYRKVSDNANLWRIKHLLNDKYFELIPGNLLDPSSIVKTILKIKPDELYNLGAVSSVGASFEMPILTYKTNAEAPLTMLQTIKDFKLKTKFYQASTSDLFGDGTGVVFERSHLNPCSPYATAKQLTHQTIKNYRELYGLKAFSGIAFPHESKRRGEEFFTQKVVKQVVEIYKGEREFIEVGNINVKRDFCYAPEVVEAYWRILQKESGDYLLCSGNLYSLRDFITEVFAQCGYTLLFSGKNLEEAGMDEKKNIRVKINPYFYRDKDIQGLQGDPERAEKDGIFKSETDLQEIIKEMVDEEFKKRGMLW